MSTTHSTVIATYSRRMRIKLPDGDHVDARLKGKRLKAVCGDRVVAEPLENETDWLITSILNRDNKLSRPNRRGQSEVLAANIELLIVVASVSPKPDWFIVDRYLSAAEDMQVPAVVVYNKVDLDNDDNESRAIMAEYRNIGYAALSCSAVTGENITLLESLINGKVAIVVGQSGVGKSSIINQLSVSESLPTAAISEKRNEGRHTTVNSVMLELASGGAIIDSPGVRDYAPVFQTAEQAGHGFREFEAVRAYCRFANCRHTREPECAVKRAVEKGAISNRRYESYKRLLNLTEKLVNK